MKSFFVGAVVVAGLSFSVNSLAADMPAATKTYNCLGCHSIEKKVVGPAWKDVAAKYKGDAGARDKLIEKMMKGGKGAWGPMPMPASPKMSKEESAQLVDFVLAL
ncbi:MAG: c-type cytochrome, partial [Sideroxydans sp.]|jgi:cytochrome c